jgi:hypothetical protein
MLSDDEMEARSDYYRVPLFGVQDSSKRDVNPREYIPIPWSTIKLEDHPPIDSLAVPRHQTPAGALIIYLYSRGMDVRSIGEKLGGLDKDFLYKNESRWWKGIRIPEHLDFDEKIVEKVMEIAKGEPEEWELEGEGRERLPPAYREIKTRIRARETRRYAAKVVENYWFWRFRRYTLHLDIPRG